MGKARIGKKAMPKEETAVLAQATFAMKPGQHATVQLKLTPSGSKMAVHAKSSPIRERLNVTVRGGATTIETLRIS